MSADGIDFPQAVLIYLCLDSGFLAGVTKRLRVCVWAQSEGSHSLPALTYRGLHVT